MRFSIDAVIQYENNAEQIIQLTRGLVKAIRKKTSSEVLKEDEGWERVQLIFKEFQAPITTSLHCSEGAEGALNYKHHIIDISQRRLIEVY